MAAVVADKGGGGGGGAGVEPLPSPPTDTPHPAGNGEFPPIKSSINLERRELIESRRG